MAQLAAHLVVALIALVVVGGATRVMEAGLACPDWPLCFGTLLPGRQMNIQVFLEWFHRLDALLIGMVLLGQYVFAVMFRAQLPRWLPWTYLLLVALVSLQAGLGALTVLHLLPSVVVTAHLVLALTLVAAMSGLTQRLMMPMGLVAPLWWRLMSFLSLISVVGQCLLGGRMATTWSAQICLTHGQSCQLLDLHRNAAISVATCIVLLVITSLSVGGWARTQWPLLLVVSLLLASQISLGSLTVHFHLKQPVLTIAHQLVAALLVAFLAALSCRRPKEYSATLDIISNENHLEHCHG